jgi:ABC-2 type transport system permease protein
MIRLVRSELLKVRTTKVWWLFAVASTVSTGLSLVINILMTSVMQSAAQQADTESAEEIATLSNPVVQAAKVYTSGQYLNGLLLLILGVLLVTNEFRHQTATTTFLTTPARRAVVTAKLVTGILIAGLGWLVSTVINLGFGAWFLQTEKLGVQLGVWGVQRAILFNLMVLALWVVLGIGIGALMRNQVAAVATSALLYTFGTAAVTTVFMLVREFVIKKDWVETAQVLVPSVAADVFTSPVEIIGHSPPFWVGGLVLFGYGVAAAGVGTWIMRARDIS